MECIDRSATVNGCALSYREMGAGPPLLWLHGAGGVESSLVFLHRLARTRRVIAPDHPGFGRSDAPSWLRDMQDLAYAYLDFLDALSLREVHLAGTSLGGWLALELAVRQPARFASLHLIVPAGLDPGQAPVGDLFGWSAAERVRRTIADPGLADRVLAMPRTAAQQAIAERNWHATVQLGQESRLHNPRLHHWLHRLNMPIQLIFGASDQLFPPAYAERVRQLLPTARFSLLADCGHLPFVEQPDQLLALLESGLP